MSTLVGFLSVSVRIFREQDAMLWCRSGRHFYRVFEQLWRAFHNAIMSILAGFLSVSVRLFRERDPEKLQESYRTAPGHIEDPSRTAPDQLQEQTASGPLFHDGKALPNRNHNAVFRGPKPVQTVPKAGSGWPERGANWLLTSAIFAAKSRIQIASTTMGLACQRSPKFLPSSNRSNSSPPKPPLHTRTVYSSLLG